MHSQILTIEAFKVLKQSDYNCSLVKSKNKDCGIVAKRPIANACWRDPKDMDGFYKSYAAPYRERLDKMGNTPQSLDFSGSWVNLALRFTIFLPGVYTAIVGSRNINHVKGNINSVNQGPLPEQVIKSLREAWLKMITVFGLVKLSRN